MVLTRKAFYIQQLYGLEIVHIGDCYLHRLTVIYSTYSHTLHIEGRRPNGSASLFNSIQNPLLFTPQCICFKGSSDVVTQNLKYIYLLHTLWNTDTVGGTQTFTEVLVICSNTYSSRSFHGVFQTRMYDVLLRGTLYNITSSSHLVST